MQDTFAWLHEEWLPKTLPTSGPLLLLLQSVRGPESWAFPCLWLREAHTDEAAAGSLRSWDLSAKWEWWVGGPCWPAHNLKSTCCALLGRNHPPEIHDPYTKTDWPGCPRRASVCSTCCGKNIRQRTTWVLLFSQTPWISLISSHMEFVSLAFLR